MCNANSSKERQIFFVMAHTQRWTNIGLSIVFFFIGLFVHTLLKTDLPNWWVSLTDNTIVSLAFDVLLFIPLAILLFLCISAYITINEVLGRILLLVWFSFLMSLFLVFVVCGSFNPLWSMYSVGSFFFYTTTVLFTLFFLDAIFYQTIRSYYEAFGISFWKTIWSLPLVFIIWKNTGIGWMWLICLQVFILYLFLNNRVGTTWAKINKYYIGGYTYKIKKGKIAMFKNYTYRKVGLYFTLYNFLDNIFLVFSSNVDNMDVAKDSLNESLDNEKASEILAEFIDNNSNDIVARSKLTFPTKVQGKKQIIVGLLFYALMAVSIYFVGKI